MGKSGLICTQSMRAGMLASEQKPSRWSPKHLQEGITDARTPALGQTATLASAIGSALPSSPLSFSGLGDLLPRALCF